MKEPTMQEVLELVEFGRCAGGDLFVRNVKDSVWGNIRGNVQGSIEGDVWANVFGDVLCDVQGKINGREWQYIETPKERAIRLIREGKGDEAIKVLEEQQ